MILTVNLTVSPSLTPGVPLSSKNSPVFSTLNDGSSPIYITVGSSVVFPSVSSPSSDTSLVTSFPPKSSLITFSEFESPFVVTSAAVIVYFA